MIKVLKEGTPKTYYHRCQHCNSKLTYQLKDTSSAYSTNCGRYIYNIICPICEYDQEVRLREYDDGLNIEELP